jgi:NitT/TauT family transport system substrate-binding protein
MKKIVLALVCSAILLVVAYLKITEPVPPIRIALNKWAGYAHAYIAKEKGYFAKNGVEVDLILEKEYGPSRKHYTNGEVDGIFEVFSDAIMDASEKISSCVVAITDYSVSSDVLIGKSEYKNASDLKDKKIGIDGINTFSNLFVLKILENAGIKEQEIYFEVVASQDVPEALDKGIIDAGHTWNPAKKLALKKGYKVLSDTQSVLGLITDVLVFNSTIIKERPEKIQAIVKSLFEAHDFLQNNRPEAIKIMSLYEGIGETEIEEGLQGIHQPNIKENLQLMGKNEDPLSLFNSGKVIIDFYLNRGQLSLPPDLDTILIPRFVKELEKP